jgi:signal transduction histidine kinase/ligand-binding sensor domain-containing protein
LRNSLTSPKHSIRPWRLACFLLPVVALACLFPFAQAKNIGNAESEYLRDHWGSERGFPGGSISAIAQSSDGYLWIATEKGLTRFDGLNFHLFQQAGPTAVPIGAVQNLFTDAEGTLWVQLKSTKILRYHDGQFEPGRAEVEFGVTAMAPGAQGSVLVSSLALGPLRYRDGKFLVLASASGSPNAPLTPNPDTTRSQNVPDNWSTGVATHRIISPNSPVTSMAETADGKIWLGTLDNGLFLLQNGQISPVSALSRPRSSPSIGAGKPPTVNLGRPEIIAQRINGLLPVENNELWIATGDGLLRWDGARLTREGVSPELGHTPILSIVRDRDANIWLVTPRGLMRLNTDGLSAVDEVSSQVSPAASALFADREGDLWIGSTRGLERLRPSTFVTYSVAEGLPFENNGPIYVDSRERVWFAPLSGGLHWLRSGITGAVNTDGLDHDVIYSIAGRDDDLWLGRQRGGLTHLRFNDEAITSQTYTHAQGLAQDSIFAVFESADGAVWAATLNQGVSRLKDGQFTTYTTTDGLPSNSVTAMAQSSDGVMWFATPRGLSSLANGRWHLYTVHEGLPQDGNATPDGRLPNSAMPPNAGAPSDEGVLSDDLDALLPDSRGIVWIGTATGLSTLQSGHIVFPQNMPPLLHEHIYGIAEDKSGWLWLSTASHILRVSRNKLLAGTLTDGDLHEYGITDGLNGTEGVKRQQSVFTDARGRIWFSTNRGISAVDPARAARTAPPALVHIDSVSADGVPFDLRAPIRIPAGRQRITLTYAGLSLSVPERVRYRYQLEGFDRGWSEAVTAREAIYTNLSPGAYHFHVMACNGDGVWNEVPATLDFNLLPALYQTSWFYLVCFLAALAVAWASYVSRVRLVAHRLDLQFQERLSERTRIARELHDTLLQSFQALTLHFQRARNLLPDRPAEAMQTLDRALDGAEQAIVESRDAILDIRSPIPADGDLAHQITALGQELAISAAEPAAFQVLIEGAVLHLHPFEQVEVFRITREALRNAFAHAQARNIEVEIAYGKKQFRLRVRDDGKGIDPHVIAEGERVGHFGLQGMRERAKRIGGQFDVWSEPGAGTEIELRIPGSIAYRPSAVVASDALPGKSKLSNV